MREDIKTALQITGIVCAILVAFIGMIFIFDGLLRDPDVIPAVPMTLSEGWEEIPRPTSSYRVYRLRTPQGWLVIKGRGVTYIPDPNHEWK